MSNSSNAVQFGLDTSVIKNLADAFERQPDGTWQPSLRALHVVGDYLDGRAGVTSSVQLELQNPGRDTPPDVAERWLQAYSEMPFPTIHGSSASNLTRAMQVAIQRRELERAMGRMRKDVPTSIIRAIREAPPGQVPDPTEITPMMHLGESETAAVSYERGMIAVIDDVSGANSARDWLGIPVISTYGFLQALAAGGDPDMFWEIVLGMRAEMEQFDDSPGARRSKLFSATREQFLTERFDPGFAIPPPGGASLPEPAVLVSPGRYGVRETRTTPVPVVGLLELDLASTGNIRVEVSDTRDLLVRETAAPNGLQAPGMDEVEAGRFVVGDVDAVCAGKRFSSPILTEVLVPPHLVESVRVNVVSQDGTVAFIGSEVAPLLVGNVQSFGSSVTGKDVVLDGGDVEAVGGTLRVESARVPALQSVKIAAGTRLSVDCADDAGALEIIRTDDNVTPDPVVTGTAWTEQIGDEPAIQRPKVERSTDDGLDPGDEDGLAGTDPGTQPPGHDSHGPGTARPAPEEPPVTAREILTSLAEDDPGVAHDEALTGPDAIGSAFGV